MYVVYHGSTHTIDAFLIHSALALEASYYYGAISIGLVVCNFMIKSSSRCSIIDRLEEICRVGMSLLIAGSHHIFIDYAEGVLTHLAINTLL